jgi:hypothetical protein
MGDIALRGNKLTRIGFKQGGAYGPLRGTSGPKGTAKAFRGKAGFKESQALQKKIAGKKIHVKADREIIAGKQTPISYTKPAWKKWKKTKSKQYKRGESFKKKTSEALEAKHPGFKKIAAKNFPSFLKSAATKAEGGRIGLKQGGAYGPLRGTSGPKGTAKAFRGRAGFLESQKLQKKLKKKSEYKLKNQLKNIQKMPDKKFKYNNPETTKARTRHGFVYDKPKSAPVKGSIGKKKYKQDWTIGHRAHQRMGLIKD